MSEFVLPSKRILVKPVVWEGWLPKGHSGAWLNDGAVMRISVPTHRTTGQLVNPLTKDEQSFFESRELSGMDFAPGDLNPYRKPDFKNNVIPYWYQRELEIRKPDTQVDNTTVLLILDLSKPDQYLDYKILLANSGSGGIVAKDWESRYDQGTHKLVLVEEGYEAQSKATTAADNIKAYKLFDKIANSQTKLYEFLSVYWLEYPNSVKPAEDSKQQWMVAQVEEIIQNNPKRFTSVMESEYDSKLLIHNGIRKGVLRLIGSTFVLMPDETPVGGSLAETILYFKDERHQEDRLKLVAQVEASK